MGWGLRTGTALGWEIRCRASRRWWRRGCCDPCKIRPFGGRVWSPLASSSLSSIVLISAGGPREPTKIDVDRTRRLGLRTQHNKMAFPPFSQNFLRSSLSLSSIYIYRIIEFTLTKPKPRPKQPSTEQTARLACARGIIQNKNFVFAPSPPRIGPLEKKKFFFLFRPSDQ